MSLKVVFILLFLLTTVAFVGCYTKLGYHDTAYLKEKRHKQIEKTGEEMEHVSDSDDSEGYYGRRKSTYRSSYPYVGDSYWVPYAPYPRLLYYPPVYYYPPPSWYYGYGYYRYSAPYYRYYGSFYPYWGYYGRYYGGGYLRAPRGTYKSGSLRKGRVENRRSRASRSLTSPKSRSERPRRGLKKDEKK